MSNSEPLMIWGFGNHEPIDMYRRCGITTTGGVPGNARWLQKWHNFFDSDESAALLEHLGVNIIHCRFYKGMGWEHEKEDFPAVRAFAQRCRKRGIKVLAYVQHATLYWELMQKEIPDLSDWAVIGENGKPEIYAGKEYWRWVPCAANPKFFDYICGILQIAMDAECFDGVLFDNVGTYPCFCERCQRKFREFVKKHYDFHFLDPDFIRLPPVPPLDVELQDPLMQAALAFRMEQQDALYAGFRQYIKSRRPDFIISGNFPLVSQQYGQIHLGGDLVGIARHFDIVMSQTANRVKAVNGCVITQIPELKFVRAQGTTALPLTDNCGATLDEPLHLVDRLCEALFGGGVLVERAAMIPKRGGEPNLALIEERKATLDEMKHIHREYRELLDLPHYEPIGVIYGKEAIIKSYRSLENLHKVQVALLRNHLPYRTVIADANGLWKQNLAGCSTLIVPGTLLLSDRAVEDLKAFPGRLIVAGDECGDYDENYSQREANPFPDAEKLPLPGHEVLLARFGTHVRQVEDNWRQYFPDMPEVSIESECAVDFKCGADGQIAGVLLTSPIPSAGGSIELAEGSWTAEPFGEASRPIPWADGKVSVPAFRGACIIKREK